MVKRYNVKDKIHSLADGDVGFEKELTELYKQSFIDLKKRFAEVVTSQDLNELSFINHKYRTTFVMFEMNDIIKDIEKSKSILMSGTLYIEELNNIISNVEDTCDVVIEELSE